MLIAVTKLISAVFLLFSFIIPVTLQAEEQRLPVSLQPEQHEWVLEYMRSMLETVADIQGDLAAAQPAQVALRAQQINQFVADTKPRGIGRSFPPAFRAMSAQMNSYWTALAGGSEDSRIIMENTRALLNTCNACHRTFYLSAPADSSAQ